MRAAPLFYGALGCLALFAGGRRWLGAWGGTWAVGLFCSSGVAMTFAWRAWMPTFTGAALVAAGAGALLWAVLAGDASAKRRTVAGLLGFLALEGAMLVRYTDVVVLAVAVAAVLLVRRFAPGRVPRRALWWWLGSVGSPPFSSSPGTRSCTAAPWRPATPRASSRSGSARCAAT